MASRKALKKNVNYIAGELFAECLMNSLYVPGTDKKKADELMGDNDDSLHDSAACRLSDIDLAQENSAGITYCYCRTCRSG
jgi:hypothetical protein